MSDYDNTDRGALFKNDKKGNDNAPDYKGKINVGGTEKELAAWITKAKSGVTYMSLKVQDVFVPQEKAAPQHTAPPQGPSSFSDLEGGGFKDAPF